MARPRVCHAKAGCVLEAAVDKSQHGPAPNRRPRAGAVAFRGAWTDHNHRGAARARRKRACCASSRETASAVVARPHICHAKIGCVLEARSRQVAAQSCTEWEPSCWCSGLPWRMDRSQPSRSDARATQVRVLRLNPRDSQCNGAPVRLRRESRLCGRPHLAHRTTALQRMEETSRWCIAI